MAPFIKLTGLPICGFADFYEDPRALMGAAPRPAHAPAKGTGPVLHSGASLKPPSGKAVKVSFAPGAGHAHGIAMIRNAAQLVTKQLARGQSVGARAGAVGARLAASVKTYDKEAKAGKHTARVQIHGETVIGATTMTRAQAAAAAKHAIRAARHAAIVAQARQAAPKVSAAGTAVLQAVAKAKKTPPGKTKSFGALIGADPDPNNPGFLTDGSPDPAWQPDPSKPGFLMNGQPDPNAQGAGVPTWDRTTGAVHDGSGAVLYPGYAESGDFPAGFSTATSVADFTDQNGVISVPDGATPPPGGAPAFDPANVPGTVAIPARGGVLTKDQAHQPVSKVPAGAVLFDVNQGNPRVGSYEFFYGDMDGIPMNRGFIRDTTLQRGLSWNSRYGKNGLGQLNWGNDPHIQDSKIVNLCSRNGTFATGQTTGEDWGPLIGDPNSPFAGLQYAVDDDQWFWQAAIAPAAVTAAQDGAAAAANAAAIGAARKTAQGLAAAAIDTIKKTAVANAAEIYGAAVQAAKDAAAAAEAQAKADADAALQTKQDTAATAHSQAQADAADIAAQQNEAAQAAQIDLDERRQALAERQAQAAADAAAAQADAGGYAAPDDGDGYAAPDQYVPPDQGYAPADDGGAAPYDESPEADSNAEATAIDDAGGGYADDGGGAPDDGGGDAPLDDGGENALLGSDGEPFVGGDGETIGIDQWGNAIE